MGNQFSSNIFINIFIHKEEKYIVRIGKQGKIFSKLVADIFQLII